MCCVRKSCVHPRGCIAVVGIFSFWSFKIKIPFSYSSRVVENKIRKEIYFLLFLKPLLVITSLVMAKEEYCTELIYLI